MNARRTSTAKRSHLSVALLAAMLVPAGVAFAQEAEDEATTTSTQATDLDKVVVTGSLLPSSQIETFTPVTVITANDIQARGFSSVSEVLQKSSFATGGIQGSQTSASFTQGAETVSLFGLPPGYVKYLIDGRPMANYPALYNGSDTFNNISGIPIDLIERIEILPGGQSSLYGSDAIAGVINVILKKSMDGIAVNVRGGGYSEGGGNSFRASVAGGFSAADDRLNVLLGAQYEERSPIWGYQRDITRSFFEDGTSAPIPSRDYLVYGYVDMANSGLDRFEYAFSDPNNCANVTSQFAGSVDYFYRSAGTIGGYCGSFNTPGYRTLLNGKEATQVYGNLTFDINDSVQLYANVMASDESIEYHVGSNYTWWGTGVNWGYYYDPAVDGLVNLQRAFSPEDMGIGGFNNSMQKDESESTRFSVGINGTVGQSAWDYDIGYTRTDYKLDELGFVRWADPINDYFETHVLGPQQGWDPYYGAYPVFTPNYAAFYSVLPEGDFASFTGYALSRSKTTDEMVRAQVTNADLFQMPGGSAGLAVAAEFGSQSWDYTPDPGYMNGDIWGTTAVAGGGERDRYAVTTELRMPVLDPLTITLSGRYDAFKASGRTIDKPTYSLGLEWRPIDTLLVRGKYGTAFRAPTLSDLYQGLSGSYTVISDYYRCSLLGIEPADVSENCPSSLANRQVFSTTEGSLDLEPINADVWSAGVVWAPVDRMSISLDYHSWDIEDEVIRQSSDNLMLQEYRCRTGLEDITSALCVAALSQITRNSVQNVTDIYTPKVNVSRRTLEAATLAFNYATDIGRFGEIMVRSNYTQNLSHEYQRYAEDDMRDLQRSPGWSSDPLRKADASVTWSKDKWSSTVYGNWFGKTPNYRAQVDNHYRNPIAGKVGSFTTYNASVSYRPMENVQLSAMVNNVFNKMPPIDHSFPGSSGEPYDTYNFNPYGRAFYIEARYNFGAK